MIAIPDRLTGLIQKLEAGQAVSQQEVDRLSTLRALDLARSAEDYARSAMAADDALTDSLRKQAEL